MSLMETITIVAALGAMGGGGLILLHTLATHRRHLFEALKIEMDIQARELRIQQQQKKQAKEEQVEENIITVKNAIA